MMSLDPAIFSMMVWTNIAGTLAWLAWTWIHITSRRQVVWSSLVLIWAGSGLLGWALSNHYTGIGVNQAALFQLQHGMAGLRSEMWLPITLVILGGASILGGLVFGLWKRSQQHRTLRAQSSILGFLLTTMAIATPGWLQAGSLIAQAWGARSQTQALIDQAIPGEIEITTSAPNSVIHIYLEGLESKYLDTPGVMPRLTTLADQALRIHGIGQAPFTGWTTAGQTASTCGFPPINEQEEQPGPWPCMNNLLAKDGYIQSYLNGSSLKFGGKGDFWKSRGFERVLGDDDVRKLAGKPNAPLSAWGVHDDVLFQALEVELERLHQKSKPFVLTALTLDTHPPFDEISPACKDQPNPNSNIALRTAQCTDMLLGNFIDLVRNQYPEVLIVVQSDHLSPSVPKISETFGSEALRDNLFLAWGPDVERGQITRNATMFDVAPTILALMGRPTPGLNLGRNLLDKAPTLTERLGQPWLNQRLNSLLIYYTVKSRRTPKEIETDITLWHKRQHEGEAGTQIDPLWKEKTDSKK